VDLGTGFSFRGVIRFQPCSLQALLFFDQKDVNDMNPENFVSELTQVDLNFLGIQFARDSF
jgi:hypothetical protein